MALISVHHDYVLLIHMLSFFIYFKYNIITQQQNVYTKNRLKKMQNNYNLLKIYNLNSKIDIRLKYFIIIIIIIF